ncbi:hypothetical protein Pan97_50330 [Bremerella volcania]|uniref:DUF2306 domain-containing protein n=1 Tax=Bremerella volcania TaxID=2527984 RepID=A0A518CFK1_9BACT|nr:DUF2306 domain-containing protein [Bremerella volcania]QDU77954.1 hypothetical protein Pan97_50330 [Bremerella volcania]
MARTYYPGGLARLESHRITSSEAALGRGIVKPHGSSSRYRILKALAAGVVVLLLSKVLVSVVSEYVNYFPPNFDAVFLLGREESFRGIYPPAFYTHIIASPIAILLAAYLMVSGKRKSHGTWHRRLGKAQLFLVLGLVAPSGFVMAFWAFTGPIAGVGFAMQAIATALTVAMAARYAMQRNFPLHQRWATHCFLLLIAPLFFRIAAGILIVTDTESFAAYQANAWLSWVVPMVAYEVIRWRKKRNAMKRKTTPDMQLQEA